MPNWSEILKELEDCKRVDALDYVRRQYLAKASEITGRNTIAYYSGFLQKIDNSHLSINDNDKNGFMAVIHKMDRSKGLDLILHTPGGDLAAAESIVDYLKTMFGHEIRAIVPQIAMSAGTMIACSCSTIIMGKQSNLGPIDPQFRGIPASGVLEEFKRAMEEVKADPKKIPVWQAIIGKYHPTFIGECEKAVKWSEQIVTQWLVENMLKAEDKKDEKAASIVAALSDHGEMMSHARHISTANCLRLGLKIEQLEDIQKEQSFQDCILSIHHAFMHTFANSNAVKIIENQNGVAMVQNAQIKMPIMQDAQSIQIPIPMPQNPPIQIPIPIPPVQPPTK